MSAGIIRMWLYFEFKLVICAVLSNKKMFYLLYLQQKFVKTFTEIVWIKILSNILPIYLHAAW